MKIINVGSAMAKKLTSRIKKSGRSISKGGEPPSFASTSSCSTSSLDLSLKTVLPLTVTDMFNLFDRDRDGKITPRELSAVLRRLGPDPLSDDEVDAMVREMDRDGDGCISLEELGAIGADDGGLVELIGGGGEGGVEELRDVFRVFDADGDGKISAEELRGVFVALGEEECRIEECRRMIKEVDSDGDGFVCFEDFVRMMDHGNQR